MRMKNERNRSRRSLQGNGCYGYCREFLPMKSAPTLLVCGLQNPVLKFEPRALATSSGPRSFYPSGYPNSLGPSPACKLWEPQHGPWH